MSLNFTIKRFFSIGTQGGQFMKKFYKKATVQKLENPEHSNHLYGVFLDGKIIRTPLRNKLALPTYELAFVIAHEFNMQNEYLKPATMPITSISRTTVDMDIQQNIRQHIEDSVNQFVRNDTILFREEGKLGDIQNAKLNPVIEYVNKLMNIKLQPTESLFSRELEDVEKENIQKYIASKDNWTLMAIEQATVNTKSTCLGVSLINGFLSIEQALEYSRLEENFQIEQFGMVEGSHDLEENTTLLNISTAKLFSYLANL
ncbi:hypothetical protein ABPG74_019590 [Tetrahymena malaccensis]